jgi:hypothetical protein
MNARLENTPLEKALLTLRPDLTLQLAIGDRVLDVELGIDGAYGVSEALLANVADLEPWKGRPDAAVLERVHSLAFAAAQLAMSVLAGAPLPSDKQALVASTLERAFAAVTLLQMATTLPGEKT